MLTRRRLLRQTFVSVVAPAGGARFGASVTAAPIRRRVGGTFVAAISVDPVAMDLASTGVPQAGTIRGTVIDARLDRDARDRRAPGRAELWEPTDAKTSVFQLRRSVKFHDGSSDVMFQPIELT